MQKITPLSILAALVLASCNQANVTGSAKTYAFAAQTQAGYTKQAGTATRTDLSTGDTTTVLLASGLKPSTVYVAHYHAQGDLSQPPCASVGPIVGDQGTLSMIGGMLYTSDVNGNLTVKGVGSTPTLGSARSIDVHEAANPAVVPLCADLTLPPTKR